MLTLAKYSFGVGDRFAHQAKAQLRACMLAAESGAEVIPVWNKSNREHTIVGSQPGSVRRGGRCRGAGARLDEAVPRRRRPHPPGNRGSLHRLAAISSRSTWPTRSASRPTPAAVEGVRRPASANWSAARDPGHRRAVRRSRAADVERDRRQVPAGRAGGRRRSIATSPRRRARASSSPKSRWTRPTARRRRPSCWSSWRRSPTRRSRCRRSRRSSPAASTRASITSATCAQFEKEFTQDLAVIAFAVAQVTACRRT